MWFEINEPFRRIGTTAVIKPADPALTAKQVVLVFRRLLDSLVSLLP
jgi:hypothetical protein